MSLQRIHDVLNGTSPCFRIGDRVMTKFTGLPGVGRVVGIMLGGIFAAFHDGDYRRWDVLFEGWLDKPIYYVMFDEPRKFVSREEFDVINRERQIPYEMLPESRVISYCEDDLERF